jgi:hypothetical protein
MKIRLELSHDEALDFALMLALSEAAHNHLANDEPIIKRAHKDIDLVLSIGQSPEALND